MNAAAIRLRGSSFLPFLIAAQRQAGRFGGFGRFALNDQAQRQRRLAASGRCVQTHVMRPHAAGEALQMANQIEGFASQGTQLQRIPADPHDKVGLAAAVGHKPLQDRHARIIAVADPDLARQRGAAFECFGAVLVGQFQMREPAAAKVRRGRASPCRCCRVC